MTPYHGVAEAVDEHVDRSRLPENVMTFSSSFLRPSVPSRTFVLLPGSWCGGWCWTPVTEHLAAAGHRVIPLTFTGVGERAHLLSAAITLETHVADIINAIRYADLYDVVLVAHSYGGIAMTVAVDRIPDRIRHVVYLDAMVPLSGECAMDIIPENDLAQRMRRIGRSNLSLPAPIGANFSTPGMRDWFHSHLTPQPLQPYLDRIELRHPHGNGLPVTYVVCTPGRLPAIMLSAERARAIASWRVLEVVSGHNVHLHRPADVAKILLDCAERG